MEICIFFGGNPVPTIVDLDVPFPSRCIHRGPRDSLISSQRPSGENTRRPISDPNDFAGGGWKWIVDCARTVAEKNRVPVGIKGAREQFSICKKARFRNSRRRRAASFFSSSSSLSGKTGTRVLKRAFDANANLSS